MHSHRTQYLETDLITESLATEYLGGAFKPLSKMTLHRWRQQGIGPNFYRVGKSIRYKVSDLDQYIRQSHQVLEVVAA